jgi:hypothetical protein
MRPPAQVLAALRATPRSACKAYGFTCRGAMLSTTAVGGPCALNCVVNDTVYQIDVTVGAGDWFIPFAAGTALHCDVPRGQPNGTMVVTFPMNGCALAVHRRVSGNRFYHDSDGRHMPAVDPDYNTLVFRANAALYEGAWARASEVFQRTERGPLAPQNFEHTLICIKQGPRWEVYQTAVVTTVNMTNGATNSWQIKDGPPVSLGSFLD